MIQTDGNPTIVSNTAANRAHQANAEAQVSKAAEAITAEAAKPVKCPNCNAPDNEEPAPVETRLWGLSRPLSIFECQCCELAWHGEPSE